MQRKIIEIERKTSITQVRNRHTSQLHTKITNSHVNTSLK